MAKVLLVGNYGCGNLGDDMLMMSARQQLDQIGVDYIVACPGQVEGSVSIMPAGIRSFLRFDWLRFFRELKKCEVVVFGGGGLLAPEERMSLMIWGQIIVMAKLYRKKVVMIGQSFSAVDNVINWLLKKVDFVSVRDSYSYRLLSESYKGKLYQVNDLAWYLNSESKKEKRNSLCLNLRPYKLVNERDLKQLVGDLIEGLEKLIDFEEIVLLPFGKEDVDFMERILSIGVKNKYKVRVAEASVESVLKELRSCKFVIAERLHACISSVKMDCSLVALSYSSKVFAMMNDIGMKSIVNLRKPFKQVAIDDLLRESLSKQYKKPDRSLDQALKDVFL
jgi:polysaccharide pyruvyl transferase CsaB